jgi:chromosome segregation ATPase
MNANMNQSTDYVDVTDDMVADLAHYLDGSKDSEKNAESLPKRIDDTLARLERRLEQQGREMKPSEQHRQLSAARQAVQAAALAMQLYHAGRQDDRH